MKTREFIEGLEILEWYRNKSGYDLGADHDVIYAFATDKALSDQDLKRMYDLGWQQECEEYDPQEGWRFYV